MLEWLVRRWQRTLSKTFLNRKKKISIRNGKVPERFSWRSKTKIIGKKRKKETESKVKKNERKYCHKKPSNKIENDNCLSK